ncbi:hypothetical protein [Acinetobacter sp. WCHAc010052]|uniref:hypothetical protein n=1 Tax=Acinetobacter sp. WCHAc010052 TaxID=2004647 RepID=UPI000B3C5A4E|nr:hypothetical protein [Acinetobacter sp. WCHAc010052]AXY59683.1 hypothetical protein CDG61_06375 [Acinetobacter sp. WCHAc010052]
MQTTIFTKMFISLLIVLFCIGFKIDNPNLEIKKYLDLLGSFSFLIMIASLRMSLIGFYQGSNFFLNHLTPNKILDERYNKLIK